MTLFVRAIFSNVWDLPTEASVGIELSSSFVFWTPKHSTKVVPGIRGYHQYWFYHQQIALFIHEKHDDKPLDKAI